MATVDTFWLRFGDAVDDGGIKMQPRAVLEFTPKSANALYLIDCSVRVSRKELTVAIEEPDFSNTHSVVQPVTVEKIGHIAFAYQASSVLGGSPRARIYLLFEKGEALGGCQIYQL